MTILRIFRAVALFFSSQKHLKLWIKISFSTFSTDVVKMSSKVGADFVCTSPATDCKNRKMSIVRFVKHHLVQIIIKL